MTTNSQFAYRIRRSKRARHARLTIRAGDGLVVVIPEGFNERQIPELITENTDWIIRQQKRLGTLASATATFQAPKSIRLPACHQQWEVKYRQTASNTIRITGDQTQLTLTGSVDDEQHIRTALRRWLKKQAQNTLTARLNVLAKRYGFDYAKVTIRHQRTRWGSCSAKGTISLNAALMLLPEKYVDHVLLHELCHTVHLDHGNGFRELLEAVSPGSRQLRAELREHWYRLPAWAV